MMKWLRNLINRYDAWCASMGLTPEQKRSCVPYRRDPCSTDKNSATDKANNAAGPR
ncbi:hypothetical protein [Vibrio ishigakensis]|uniref:hypothetical protein n=1 Tax=Vibrio ishigakensis TaxID=1481914 RepID=UPI0021C432D6|nr:hypothetical protein [Vibrio ishigakensis]